MLVLEERNPKKKRLAVFLGAAFGLGSALAFSFFSEAGFLAGAFLGFSSSSSSSSPSSETGGTSSSSLVKSSPDSSSDSYIKGIIGIEQKEDDEIKTNLLFLLRCTFLGCCLFFRFSFLLGWSLLLLGLFFFLVLVLSLLVTILRSFL